MEVFLGDVPAEVLSSERKALGGDVDAEKGDGGDVGVEESVKEERNASCAGAEI